MYISAKAKFIISGIFLLITNLSHAQKFNPTAGDEPKRSPIRKVLNMFSLNISSGYGLTMYTQRWDDYTAIVSRDSLFLFDGSSYYKNWLNKPASRDFAPASNDIRVGSDTSNIRYRAFWGGVPLQLHLNFHYKRIRVGGGVEWELHKMGKLSPTTEKNLLPDYSTNASSTTFFRYFGMLGYRAYDFIDYSFAPELRFGKLKMGSAFDKQLVSNSMYVNFGVSIEKNFSEYLRAYVRPSLDFKSFTTSLPGSDNSVIHKQPALYVHAGIAIHYPEIPRCPISACRTQMKHIHGNKEFRGQPIWRKQNPKIGENDPVPRKYRGSNKRKRSPY